MQTIAAPRLSALALALALAFSGGAQAAPTGGVVVPDSGTASISTSGNHTTIAQTTQKVVINWQGFSIAQNESVNFQQPNSTAIALNRVLGNEKSLIHGKLTANGRVFLVNTQGILIGSGAAVDVGGLVASAHDIADADFEAGLYRFTGGEGAGDVTNLGHITTTGENGFVALLGRNVSNNGFIVATQGTVTLNGAEKITLNFDGDNLIGVTLEPGALAALVENGEAIQADGGRVILSAAAAEAIVNAQVNNTGIVRARTLGELTSSVDIEGGTVHAGGTLDVSAPGGGDGGTVTLTGERVDIASGLNLDASATEGNATGQLVVNTAEDFTIGVAGNVAASTLGRLLDKADVRIASQGDVTLADATGWRAANTLALAADKDIHINNALAVEGAGRLELETGGDYYIRTPASYAGVDVLPATESSITVSEGKQNELIVDGQAYSLGDALEKIGQHVKEVAGAGASRPKEDTSNSVYGRIDLGNDASLSINGEEYTLIHSLDELTAISGKIGNYALADDLDASGKIYTVAIVASLAGDSVFTGLGHVVDKLTIDAPGGRNLGLFGTSGSSTQAVVIRDVGLKNIDITGRSYIGTVSGRHYGDIYNVYANGVIQTTGSSVGGIAGLAEDGKLLNTHAEVNITASGTTAASIGGLVGVSRNVDILQSSATGDLFLGSTQLTSGDIGGLAGSTENADIKNSYAAGNVIYNEGATGSGNIGGLIGRVGTHDSGLKAMTLENSFATGNVVSPGGNAGGLIGYVDMGKADFTIRNSYASGDVSTTESRGSATELGGLIGRGYFSSDSDKTITITHSSATGNVAHKGTAFDFDSAGGFIGDFSITNIFISYSYATGSITGSSKSAGAGGFIGNLASNGNALIEYSYAAGRNISGYTNVGGFAGQSNGHIMNAYYEYGDPAGPGLVQGVYAVGGFIGFNHSTGIIEYAYTIADVNNPFGATWAAGTAGGFAGANAGIIRNVTAKGRLNSENLDNIGGLVGWNYHFGDSPALIDGAECDCNDRPPVGNNDGGTVNNVTSPDDAPKPTNETPKQEPAAAQEQLAAVQESAKTIVREASSGKTQSKAGGFEESRIPLNQLMAHLSDTASKTGATPNKTDFANDVDRLSVDGKDTETEKETSPGEN
ncbi:MAG: filamentous hemagglutinin N-terminal domain-containing protein [Azoarcus sp.]|jgi:filamentous hemagglutinin family protein|nr:filamentous hemagglutinin N-terminal domain-containing protein [Azoarcus sp.]